MSSEVLLGAGLLEQQTGFRHEDLLGVVQSEELQVFAYQFRQKKGVIIGEAFTSSRIFPVEGALATHFRVLHVVLVVDDLEDRAADLSSELPENAVGFKGLDH